MKKILLLLFFTSFVNSQEIKTYKGVYNDGIANYQYYENDSLERIKHGKFEYVFNNKDYGYKGQYYKNEKTGVWEYYDIGPYNEYRYEAKGEIKKDKKNGKWVFTRTEISTKKIKSYYLYFKNDTVINLNIKKPALEIQTDSVGKFVNPVVIRKGGQEYILEVYKNVIIKFVKRELSTGEIKAKYLPSKQEICQIIDNLPSNYDLITRENIDFSKGKVFQSSKSIDDFYYFFNSFYDELNDLYKQYHFNETISFKFQFNEPLFLINK